MTNKHQLEPIWSFYSLDNENNNTISVSLLWCLGIVFTTNGIYFLQCLVTRTQNKELWSTVWGL